MKEEKTPHERRQLSMQVAGIMTALLFVAWLGTLGVRLANTPAATPNTNNTAATLIAVQEAASSTMLGY